MFKIFQKIRLEFISSKNLIGFFTYAIGEIILVVIGILIALSINNWNATSQLTKQSDKALEIIKENLSKDTLNLNINLVNGNRIISYHNSLKNSDSIGLRNELLKNIGAPQVVSNKTGYTIAIENDLINSVRNQSLREKLVAYYEGDLEIIEQLSLDLNWYSQEISKILLVEDINSNDGISFESKLNRIFTKNSFQQFLELYQLYHEYEMRLIQKRKSNCIELISLIQSE